LVLDPRVLDRLLEAARSGDGGVLLVLGEPGAGKSSPIDDSGNPASASDVLGEVVIAYIALRPEAQVTVEELKPKLRSIAHRY
jgi:hypothetical protein